MALEPPCRHRRRRGTRVVHARGPQAAVAAPADRQFRGVQRAARRGGAVLQAGHHGLQLDTIWRPGRRGDRDTRGAASRGRRERAELVQVLRQAAPGGTRSDPS